MLAQAREPEPVQVWELAVEPLELAQAQELARKPAQQSELAALLEQARELRVSRQLEPQQHRLQAAAQELLPYLPALPMKAPC